MVDDSYKRFQELVKKSKYAPKETTVSPVNKPPTSQTSKVRPEPRTDVVTVTNPQTGQKEQVTNYYDEQGRLRASLKIDETKGTVTGAVRGSKGGGISGVKGTVSTTQTVSPEQAIVPGTAGMSIGAGIGVPAQQASFVRPPTPFSPAYRQPQSQIVGSTQTTSGAGVLITGTSSMTGFGTQSTQAYTPVATSEGGTLYQEATVQPVIEPNITKVITPDTPEIIKAFERGFGLNKKTQGERDLMQEITTGSSEYLSRTTERVKEGKYLEILLPPLEVPKTTAQATTLLAEQATSFLLLRGAGQAIGATVQATTSVAEPLVVEIIKDIKAITPAIKPQVLPVIAQQPIIQITKFLTQASPVIVETAKATVRMGEIPLVVGFSAYSAGEAVLESASKGNSMQDSLTVGALEGVRTYGAFKIFDKGFISGAKTAQIVESSLFTTGKVVEKRLTKFVSEPILETTAGTKSWEAENLGATVAIREVKASELEVKYTANVFGIKNEAAAISQPEQIIRGKIDIKGSMTKEYINAKYSGSALKENIINIEGGKDVLKVSPGELWEPTKASVSGFYGKTATPLFTKGILKGTPDKTLAQAIGYIGKSVPESEINALTLRRTFSPKEIKVVPMESTITTTVGKSQENVLFDLEVPGVVPVHPDDYAKTTALSTESTMFDSRIGAPAKIRRTQTVEEIFEPSFTTVKTKTLPLPGKVGTSFESETIFVEQPKTTKTVIETFSDDIALKSDVTTFESKGINLEGKSKRVITPPKAREQVFETYGGHVDAELVTPIKIKDARLRIGQEVKSPVKMLNNESGYRRFVSKAKESRVRMFKPTVSVPESFFDAEVGMKAETVVAKARTESTLSGVSQQFKALGDTEATLFVRRYQMPKVGDVRTPFIIVRAPVAGMSYNTNTLSQQLLSTSRSQLSNTNIESKINLTQSNKVNLDAELKTGSSSSLKSENIIKIDSVLKAESTIKIDTKQELKTSQVQITKQNILTTLKNSFKFGSVTIPRPPPVPLGDSVPGRMFKGMKLDFGSSNKGYDAYVREKGKLVKVTQEPVSREVADRVGRYYVDETTSASYKVMPSSKPASLSQGNVPNVPASQFRSAKRLSGFTVEKNKFRIDSPGEKKGITAKGLRAMRNKNTFKLQSFKVRL